jgi:hypothetical protein
MVPCVVGGFVEVEMLPQAHAAFFPDSCTCSSLSLPPCVCVWMCCCGFTRAGCWHPCGPYQGIHGDHR